MQRSRKRKLNHARQHAAAVPLASILLLAGLPVARAQQTASEGLEEVIVTAQKRSQSLQDVPLSIQAFGAEKLEQLNITSFNDYARLLPSVSFQSSGPGFAQVYMRGVASGANGNHSGPLPSVGQYLDEQPITTIQGALDVHIYDIARVEALAGPQGTLYGASSQSGTLRIITNKPVIGEFQGGYAFEGSTTRGSLGYVAEGFINLPVNDHMAARIVGWKKQEAGYIDNKLYTRTFPSWDAATGGNGTVNNAAFVKNNYNDVDTIGARAALKIDLNDNWTITPSVMAQKQDANGSFGYVAAEGDLVTGHGLPEYSSDKWLQSALTIEGHVGSLDVVYTGSYLHRTVETASDYADYSFFYDTLFGSGAYFYDDNFNVINPSQFIDGLDGYEKTSHELRISTATDAPLRFVGGLFLQRQRHNIQQNYQVAGLGSQISVPGWDDTIWLTQQVRVDRDYAAFGELTYDLTDKLTVTAGIRFFKANNTLKGFFGYGAGFSSRTGEAACFDPTDFRGAPCINLDKGVKENGNTPKLSVSYKIDEDRMVYLTYSKGFRPGGINRRGGLQPYTADFLTSLEAGWKTTWMDNRLRFNGAVFWSKWKDFQFSFLGANGLTEIANAAQARIKGMEADVSWVATEHFTLSGGIAILNPVLTENYCGELDANGDPITDCANPQAPTGTTLPVTAKVKGNVTGRYEFNLGTLDAHVQGTIVYQSSVWADLRTADRDAIGQQPAYTMADMAFGIGKDAWQLELTVRNLGDKRAEITRSSQCDASICGGRVYTVVNQPRTIALRYSRKF